MTKTILIPFICFILGCFIPSLLPPIVGDLLLKIWKVLIEKGGIFGVLP